MSNRKSRHQSRGGALLWIIIWLAGIAGIAWLGLNIAVPRFEQKLQTAVLNSVSALNDSAIVVAVKGRQATLFGNSANIDTQNAMIAAAGQVFGVEDVSYQLTETESATVPVQLAESQIDSPTQEGSGTADTAASPIDAEQTVNATANEITLPLESESAINNIVPSGASSDGELPLDPSDIAANENSSKLSANASMPEELPSLSLRVAKNILALEGYLASDDDPNPLIQAAMTTFNVDMVSNGIVNGDHIAAAGWLPTLERVVPLMTAMSDPLIEVHDRQVTLAGKVADQKQHDAIIGEALSSLGEYSLVERISVDASLAEPIEPDGMDEAAEGIAAAALSDAIEPNAMSEAAKLPEMVAVDEPSESAALVKPIDAPLSADKPIDASNATGAAAGSNPPAPLESTVIVKQTVSLEPAAIAKSAESTATAISEEPVKPIAAVTPAEPFEPVVATPTEPLASIAAVTPAESHKPDAAAKPAELLESVAIAKPDGPAVVAKPTATIDDTAMTDPQKLLESVAPLEMAGFELMQNTRQSNKNSKSDWVDNDKLLKELNSLASLHVLFETDRDILTSDSLTVLDQVAHVLVQFPDTVVTIAGHTDAAGPRDINLSLSLSRATTVRDHLIDYGVSVYRLRAKGYGEDVPIANNRTPEGRATNRRIEFTF